MGSKKKLLTPGIFLLFLVAHTLAAEPIVKIDHIRPDRVMTAGFELKSGGEFNIKGVGLLGLHSDDFSAYAWLLDSATRKPVWIMERQNTDRKGRRGLRQADEKINLKPGKYELYYYAGTNWTGEINISGNQVFQFLGDLFNGDLQRDIEDYIDDLNIAVYPPFEGYRDYSTFTPDGLIPNALIQFSKVGNSSYLQQGFKLDKPTTIHLYGLCEFPSGYKSPIDFAWIMNADTQEKVWEMDRWNTDPAGGGRKNRVADADINLERGSYVLVYVTDDSHSYDKFNVMPPYDPLDWGVAILPTAHFDKSAFSLFTPKGRGDALISMTRVGNNESIARAFKLDNDISLHIFCLGEWNGDFADYGWIENASTSKTVWEMSYRNTENAGGASKNRKFDSNVTLPAGTYIAHYTTDDSHSYNDWNDSPPYEAENWGLSIYPGMNFDKSRFHLIDEDQLQKNSNNLVKMTALGDNVRRRAKFTLDRQSKIHVYAVGEGDADEMFDFGWIVNDKTGKTIWEMTWRNTEPAGGAMKNRMFDDSIILDAGTYEVNFVTDGSHSFNDWNSAKPRDPSSWGITVSLDKNSSN
jgi:hypothetical protein